MKKILAVILSICTVLPVAACSTNTAKAVTEELNKVEYEQNNDVYFNDAAFLSKLAAFSADIYELSAKEQTGNYSLSPVSIYMALAVLNAVGDEGIKSDIRTLFGMTDEDIAKTGDLFLSLLTEKTEDGKTITAFDLNNSIWLNKGTEANQSVLDKIAKDLFVNAFRTPFKEDNKKANEDIRKFIKEKTKGLIDEDFDLSPSTLFAIINTLYLKDIWNEEDGLAVSKGTFYENGAGVQKDFLYADYVPGEAGETAVSNFFYARTLSGYKVKFIVPKENKTVASVMTKENISAVNAASFKAENGGKKHYTRCIFPKFKTENETDLKKVLEGGGYLPNAFNNFNSELVRGDLVVSDIKHRVALTVDEKGVEGAAVTVIAVKENAIFEPERVFHDFTVDKEFGFLITDINDVILFAGQIVKP